MSEITVPKGDKGFPIVFTITDSAGVAYNVTDYTVKLVFWPYGNPAAPIVNGTCALTTPISGIVTYTTTATDFTTSGRYVAELQLTKTGVIESTRTFDLLVTDSP